MKMAYLQSRRNDGFFLMVSLLLALPAAENTMNNTIDDADCIINWIDFIITNQGVKNPGHSHSIVAGGLLETS